MTKRNLVPLGTLGIALLIGAGTLATHARQAGDAGGGAQAAIGSAAVVDMEYLYAASGARDQVEQRALVEVRAEGERRLSLVENAPFLTPAERVEYLDLLSKNKLTDAEQARTDAIKTLSQQRGMELQTLQVKKEAELTPAEKTRVNELVEQQRALEQVLPGIQEVVHLRQNQQTEALRREQILKIRTVVGQVAKEKGFVNVFDANALVYSPNNLTALALQRLSKRPAK